MARSAPSALALPHVAFDKCLVSTLDPNLGANPAASASCIAAACNPCAWDTKRTMAVSQVFNWSADNDTKDSWAASSTAARRRPNPSAEEISEN